MSQSRTTLLVLAAGMGSRYGGLKQMDVVGPSGETLMDYSVHDAIEAGFDHVVFVIRRDMETAFREKIGSRYEKKVAVDYAFQDLHDLPEGFAVPDGREKPWGTGHAVLAARDVIDSNFAVINADDYYGRHSYQVLADSLKALADDAGRVRYAMVGFTLSQTLSAHGSVSRGVCDLDSSDHLAKIVEHVDVHAAQDGGVCEDPEGGGEKHLPGDTVVSMNMWGFTPSIFVYLREHFLHFLSEKQTEPKAEFFLPFVVDDLIETGRADVDVLHTRDRWFGVTYREDKDTVVASIQRLVEEGVYPEKLWQ